MLSIFISYASEDQNKVRDLAFRLAYDGFDPWMDKIKLLPGQDWDLEIRKAIETCDVVIVCLSTALVKKRGYVQKEIRKVLDVADEFPEGEVFLIPLKLEECQVPHTFKKWHWGDLFKADGYEKLRTVLNKRANELHIDVRCLSISGNLVGIYLASGNNNDGTPYDGRVLISRLGDNYQVTWQIGEDRFQALGTLEENRLCVKGDFDFVYEVRSDGTLFGEWEPGATEKLFPMHPNVHW